MSERLPNFAIIGAQKSASTYVHSLLSVHPDIYMPAQEVRFFEDPEYGSGNLNSLHELFHGRKERVLGIKRPDYLARPEVASRLRQHLPDLRMIAILREPVSRLISAYYYYIKLGFLPAIHINEGLRSILDGDDLGALRAGELLEYGRYASHLKRFLELFPKEQLLILLQEDVTEDPATTAARLYSFLGVPLVDKLPVITRDNSGLYSIPRLRLLTQRNRFLYEYDDFGKLIQKNGGVRYAAAAVITACDQYLLAPVFGNKKPTIEADLLSRLQDYYADELKALVDILDQPLPHWRPRG